MSLGFYASVCRLLAVLGLRAGERLPEDHIARPCSASPQRGFTLIELLLVIFLLSIIASLATITLAETEGLNGGTESKLVLIEMTEIRKALLQFRRDVGHFPDAAKNFSLNSYRLKLLWSCQSEDDSVDPDNPIKYNYDIGCKPYDPDRAQGWNGFYMLSEQGDEGPALYDPWGRRYHLLDPDSAAPGSGFARIVSGGANGIMEEPVPTDPADTEPCLPEPGSDDIILCLVQ